MPSKYNFASPTSSATSSPTGSRASTPPSGSSVTIQSLYKAAGSKNAWEAKPQDFAKARQLAFK